MKTRLDDDELDCITNAMRVWRTGTITSNYEGFEDDIDCLVSEVRLLRCEVNQLRDAIERVKALPRDYYLRNFTDDYLLKKTVLAALEVK